MRAKLKHYLDYFIGTNQNFENNELFLISVVLVAIGMSLFSTICNFFLELNTYLTLVSFLGCLVFVCVYWLARFKRKFVVSSILNFGVIMLYFNLLWLFGGGSKGPIPLLYVVVLVFFIYIWDGRFRYFFLLGFIVNLVFQVSVEVWYPWLITDYQSNEQRLWDMYISYIIIVCLCLVLVAFMKKLFDNERQKALQSERLKSAFLANMSHEIRTPMNGIIGFSEMLRKDNLPPEKQKKYVETIIDSANRLLGIVNDVLDISKIEAGLVSINSEAVEIDKVISQIVHLYEPRFYQRGLIIRSKIKLNAREMVVITDSAKLWQVLNNLVANAMKFTHQGSVDIGCYSKGDKLIFYVKDTGIGIAKEFHSKVFERFRQVEHNSSNIYGGTGLGLAICKSIVELLGGEIWLESAVNKGTTFFFTIDKQLPFFSNNHISKKGTEDVIEVLNISNMKVLVAEDEDINFFYLNEVLVKAGVKVLRATNGLKAVEICGSDPNINLVLMDIKMPELDGIEAMKLIKQTRPQLPIVAQTAYALSSEKEKGLKAGFDDYLSKPIKAADVYVIVKKFKT